MATLPAPPSTPLASTSDEVTLVCVLGDHQVRTQVAGRDPVPITLTAVISADGIHEWNRVFGHPDFVQCCQDFQTWVATYHRDDYASIDYGIWATVAEARASGELTARLADEWVAFTTPGQYETSPRICKSPCSAPQPEDSPDPTSPTTSQPG